MHKDNRPRSIILSDAAFLHNYHGDARRGDELIAEAFGCLPQNKLQAAAPTAEDRAIMARIYRNGDRRFNRADLNR
jgi:hypothetical protein